MGGLIAKANCMSHSEVAEMVSMIQLAESSRQEVRPSKEILKELKKAGIIPKAGSVGSTLGGLRFEIEPDGIVQCRNPRRLPALLQRQNKVAPQGTENDTKQRNEMVYARRQEVLKGKARIGRSFTARREAVLRRREEKIQMKIRKTEQKLRRNNQE